MKLWSRGLGKTEVYMDFRHYHTIKDPDSGQVLIIGKMLDPVDWEFKITLQPEDIGGIVKMALNRHMIFFVLRNLHQYLIYLFQRKKFKDSSSDMAAKVNTAYDQVMKVRSRPQHNRLSPRSQVA